ncbi:MAG: AbrB/MazE/SpoVT family DNA-binding domain-containing protein [Nanoarchaeota archaeon]
MVIIMRMETAKMSERGQIIIPKEIREEVGASTDSIFAVSTLDKDTIVMRKIDRDALVEEFRRIRSRTKKMSPAQIEAEIHAYRKEKSSS